MRKGGGDGRGSAWLNVDQSLSSHLISRHFSPPPPPFFSFLCAFVWFDVQVPMGWTISPGLVSLAPAMLEYTYSIATANDSFVTGPSGLGYIYPSSFRLDMFACICVCVSVYVCVPVCVCLYQSRKASLHVVLCHTRARARGLWDSVPWIRSQSSTTRT